MLAWFRRHAKVLMVVLGSAAMAIFGLGPVFDQLASQNQQGDDGRSEVLYTWKGGDITRANLDQITRTHYQTQRFLAKLTSAAIAQKGDEFNSFAVPISAIPDGDQEEVDSQILNRFLLAERAKLEGMVVSDRLIDDYLQSYSGDVGFSNADMKAINNDANNRRISLMGVKEHLKFELLAQMMATCRSTGMPRFPNTSESIELYGRAMDQVDCEVMAVPVEPFIAKISEEPTAAELKKLYEEGKFEFADPTGDRPGFKIGRKVNLQYFIANAETFLQNEINKLTAEEVQKEYDRLVAEKNDLVMEPIVEDDNAIEIKDPPPVLPGDQDPAPAPGDGTEAPSDVAPPPTAGDDTKMNAPESSKPAKTEEAQKEEAQKEEAQKEEAQKEEGKKEEGKKEEGKKEEGKTEEAKNVEAGKTEDPKKDDSNSSGENSDGNEKKESGDQSFHLTQQKQQYVSLTSQDEKAKQDAETEKKGSNTESADQKAEPAKQANEAGNKKQPSPPVETPDNQNEASKKDAKQDENSTDEASSDPQDPESAKTDEPKMEEPKPIERKPKPLKDVAEDVKRAMCQDKAQAAMVEALKAAEVLVYDQFVKTLEYEHKSEIGNAEVPEPLDIEAIAKKYNLVAKETGLVGFEGLAADSIGQAEHYVELNYQGRPIPRYIPVVNMVFGKFNDLKAFDAKKVESSSFIDRSAYLYWMTEKTESRVPSLDECRPEIEKFWKTQKALELAKAEANTLKEKVQAQSSKRMSEIFPDRVTPTGAFTWFSSFGNGTYSIVNGVTDPGEAFMEKAFSLAPFEVGVAANNPKDTVYVIQVLVAPKNTTEIGEDYLTNQLFKFKRTPMEVGRVNQQYAMQLQRQWAQELRDTLEFESVNR